LRGQSPLIDITRHTRRVTRSQRITLLAAISGTFVVGVDSTVVNVALPSIERSLGGGLAGQQWVVNAYLLMLGSLILIGGSLGDLFGERRIFMIGVAGFGAVSVICAVAPTIGVLVVGRGLQGAFGALLTPGSLALLVSAFDQGERGAAIGSWTAWSGIAFIIGPLIGGQLVDLVSWRAIFAVNVPFVFVTLALATRIEVGGARRAGARVDVAGALLCALGLAGPVLALIEQPRRGWGDPLVAGAGLGGVALLACFLVWERRAAHPMLDLHLFARRNFAVGNLLTLCMYAGLGVVFFLLVLFLQQVAGWEATEAGVATVPTSIVMFALSRRFGALADRFGPRFLMGAGPLVAAAGLLLFQLIGPKVDYISEVLPGLLVFALGLSMTVAPLTAAVLQGSEKEAGIASGVNNAIARVAGLLGTAAVGAAIAQSFGSSLDSKLSGTVLGQAARAAVAQAKRLPLGTPSVRNLASDQAHAISRAAEQASLHSFHMGMMIAAALVAAGGVAGAIGIRNPATEDVCAVSCPGGQLVGASSDVDWQRAGREAPAQPTGSPA
jgi:EmrB/QacA subfamily drug resistance transporter